MRYEPVSTLAQNLLDGYFAGAESQAAATMRIAEQIEWARRSPSPKSALNEERLDVLAAAAEAIAAHGAKRFPEAEIRLVAHLARTGRAQSESNARMLTIS